MKAEFVIEEGEIIEIVFKPVRGREKLPRKQLDNFKKLVTLHADEIVQRWIDFFVLGKKIKSQTIDRRLK